MPTASLLPIITIGASLSWPNWHGQGGAADRISQGSNRHSLALKRAVAAVLIAVTLAFVPLARIRAPRMTSAH